MSGLDLSSLPVLANVRGYSPNPYTIPEELLIKINKTLNVNRGMG